MVAVVTNEFSEPAPRLVRVAADGRLDASFDGDGIRPLTAETEGAPDDAVVRDGAVLTAAPADHDRLHLSIRRYDAAGDPDAAFGGDGHVLVEAALTDHTWMRLAWAPDGSVYVGYSAPFTDDGRPVAALSVVRLGADGARDPEYGDFGAARVSFGGEFDRISDVLVDGAGRVVLSAERQPFDRMRVARFAAGTGGIDHSFGDAGVQELHFAPHLASSDGVVELAGGDLLVTGDVVVRDACCLGDTDIGLARLHSSMPHLERFVSIDPVRVLDTRAGGGAVAAGTSRTLPVLGVRTVPATGVSSVVVNVTVVGTTSGGYLTVYEAGRPRPPTSNVDFAAGGTVANLATVKVGDAGALSVYLGGGSAHVLVDVAGYYTDGTTPSAGSGFIPVLPARLLDTRPGRLAGDGAEVAVGPHGTLRLKVAGRGGMPATGVAAVVMTVTAVTPTSTGFVTAWPSGPRPVVSNLNFARRTTSNLVTVKVDAEGFVSLFNSNGTTHLLADVAGYYDPSSAGTPRVVTARRAYDSRRTLAFGPGETRGISPDLHGIPARPGRAVVLNLTVTGATAGTFLTVHPHGSPRPRTSNVNVSPGQTVAVQVVVPASEDGFVSVYNALGSVHLVIDYQGWFQAP